MLFFVEAFMTRARSAAFRRSSFSPFQKVKTFRLKSETTTLIPEHLTWAMSCLLSRNSLLPLVCLAGGRELCRTNLLRRKNECWNSSAARMNHANFLFLLHFTQNYELYASHASMQTRYVYIHSEWQSNQTPLCLFGLDLFSFG